MLSIDGGAEPTEPNQYPWMTFLRVARIQREKIEIQGEIQGEKIDIAQSNCGSVLIRFPGNNDSSDIVLTAAHCLTDDSSAPVSSPSKVEEVITVYAGGHLLKEIETAEARNVTRVEIHPKYTRHGPYDIAMLKLSKPLKFDDKIQGIELPRKGHVLTGGAEEKCIVSGWGKVTYKGEKDPDSLMHMNVSVASESQCDQLAKRTEVKEDGKMLENDQTRLYCVYSGTPEKTKPSICHGDSGGPLFCKGDRNNWITHGVASSSNACDADPSTGRGVPSFYVKLDGHLDWINEKIEDMSSM